MIRNSNFKSAFLQGLAAVLFLYVAVFTFSIFKSQKNTAEVAALATATIEIARPEAMPIATTLPPEPNTLNPQDQVPAPETVAVDPTATPEETPATTAGSDDLIEITSQGPLPKRSPTGMTPFNAYKKQYADPGVPVIALMVLDYGLSEADSKEALKQLPGEVSLVLNPYISSPNVWKGLAEADGHEFWINLPLENQIYPDKEDPGPQALLAHSDFKYNQDKFLWALTRTTGYVGIAGYTDATFLNAQSALKILWDEGYNRGIGYFEINPAGLEGVEMNAIEKGAPYVRNQAIFDESVQTIQQWLASLEMEASNLGYTVGVIKTPYPRVTQAIGQWAADLKTRGLALAPVSALAQVTNTPPPAPAPAPTAPAETSHAAP